MLAEEEPIRTPDQRIRVFVSSTLGELAEERRRVRAAVGRMHLAPVMFELGARPHPPRELYRAYLRQSHVFVGIYHQRYGWVAPGETMSGLEDEFRLSEGMPRLLYLKRPAERIEPRLQAMLDQVSEQGIASYRHFADAAELAALVEEDLAVLLSERFLADQGSAYDQVRPRPAPVPIPLTPTVGRQRELADLAALEHDRVRLLTVTGPGGVGKTRLALEVARAVGDHFADGIGFVPVEDVPSADLVLATIAASLQIHEAGTRPILDRLVDELHGHQMLVVLDNMEHLRAAGPELASLLAQCPGLCLLVTSRQALRVRGEQEYHLAPLPVPDHTARAGDTTPSVELFAQRATDVNPGFALTDANRAAVHEIVRLLDGLPLAIELAAARSRLFPPAALAERLTRHIDVLAEGAGDMPARQRTLKATLDWSLGLLHPAERALFARMSIFAGDATLDAVEAVCGDDAVPDLLGAVSSLLEKNLLVTDPADAADVPRLSMLHVVRVRAGELLRERGEAEGIGDRHAHWYTDLVEPADIIRHNDALRHWRLIERDVDNLLAAARWATRRADADIMVALGRRLWPWLAYSGRVGELKDAVPRSVDAIPDDPDARHRAYLHNVAACYTQTQTGDHAGALNAAERALALAGGVPNRETALLSTAVRLLRAVLRMSLGQVQDVADDLDAALTTAQREDNAWLLGHATLHRGVWRALTGHTADARRDLDQTVTVATAMGHDVLLAQAIGHLATLDLMQARLDDCRDRLHQQIEHLRRARNLEGLATALDTTAALATHHQLWETAARATATAELLRERVGLPSRPLTRDLHDAAAAAARIHLGDRAQTVRASAKQSDPWAIARQALIDLSDTAPANHGTRGGV